MASLLSRKALGTTTPIVLTSAYKNLMEDHLSVIAQKSTSYLSVSETLSIRCRYDFYALLTELKVTPDKHWLTMRLNGYDHPAQYTGEIPHVVVPPTDFISLLIRKLKSIS